MTTETIKSLIDKLQYVNTLDGFYKIRCYDDDFTILGIYLPNGLCLCERYNGTINEYDSFEMPWNKLSEDYKIQVLLEVAYNYKQSN